MKEAEAPAGGSQILRSWELEAEIRLLTFSWPQALRLYSWLPPLIKKLEAQGRLCPSPIADVTPFPGPEGSGARLCLLPHDSHLLCAPGDESQVAGTALQLLLVPTCARLPQGNCEPAPVGPRDRDTMETRPPFGRSGARDMFVPTSGWSPRGSFCLEPGCTCPRHQLWFSQGGR